MAESKHEKQHGLMQNLSPYLRLMRMHQPIGIWLVFWPCAWATMLASPNELRLDLLLIFFIGAVLTRSAGCVVNDMADREFDKHVERTKLRPLASGELNMTQAKALLALLTMLSASLLLLLPPMAFYLALPAAGLIVAYPFMKRITWWPQAFLGVTFNWGIFIAWGSVAGEVNLATFLLYAACLCWTLGYDTIYGHQDKKDDVKIGVKSSSLRLGANTKQWVSGFYAAMALLLTASMALTIPDFYRELYGLGLTLTVFHLIWQVWRVDIDSPQSCLKAFKSNAWLGPLFLLPLIIQLIFGTILILID